VQESVNKQRPKKIFADAKEVEITRAIVEEFYTVLQDRAESDVIIIGAGPAGLTAARELSLMGYKILVIETKEKQQVLEDLTITESQLQSEQELTQQ